MGMFKVQGAASGNSDKHQPALIRLVPVDVCNPIQHITLTTSDESLQKLLHAGKEIEIRIYEPTFTDEV